MKRTITIGENNIRGFSTELECCTFNQFGSFSSDDFAHLGRASKSDFVNIRMFHNRCATMWSVTRKDIDHTLEEEFSDKNFERADLLVENQLL